MGATYRHVAAAVAVLLLSGCTGATPEPPGSSSPTPSSAASPNPTATSSGGVASPEASPSDSPVASPTPDPSGSAETTKKPTTKPDDPTPLPKVQRSGAATKPTVSAAPAEIKEDVEYGDGVSLRIADIEFGSPVLQRFVIHHLEPQASAPFAAMYVRLRHDDRLHRAVAFRALHEKTSEGW